MWTDRAQNLRMSVLQNPEWNGAPARPVEGRGSLGRKEKTGRQGRHDPRSQTTKGGGSRKNGRQPDAPVGKRGRGFLGGPVPPQPKATPIICGISRKGRNEDSSAGTSPKKPRITTRGTRPIIEMLLHQGNHKHRVRALLDTGCSIALINQHTVERLGLKQVPHPNPVRIENYTREVVPGAGQY